MNQAVVCFTRWGFTRWCLTPKFDFAHALDDGLPEIAEGSERFHGHNRFVEHLPDDRQLDECAGAALARNKSIGEANEFEEAILPGGDADLDIDPGIRLRGEDIGGHSIGFSTGFLRASRNAGHHSAVAAGA